MIELILGWLTLLITGDFYGYSVLGVQEDSYLVDMILSLREAMGSSPAPHVEYVQPFGEYVEAVYAE